MWNLPDGWWLAAGQRLASYYDNSRGQPHCPQTGSARQRGPEERQVFREYDIRGVVERDFDDLFVVEISTLLLALRIAAVKR